MISTKYWIDLYNDTATEHSNRKEAQNGRKYALPAMPVFCKENISLGAYRWKDNEGKTEGNMVKDISKWHEDISCIRYK